MRDLLERYGHQELTNEEYIQLENVGLIMWYDGYHITELGWMLLLRGRAPADQIKALLDMEEPEYLSVLSELKEKSL
jgi:hypothetical protein